MDYNCICDFSDSKCIISENKPELLYEHSSIISGFAINKRTKHDGSFYREIVFLLKDKGAFFVYY